MVQKKQKAKKQSAGSKGEEALAAQLQAAGVGFEREQLLIPGRRFRFDFVITGSDLVIEVEGGTWSWRSAHQRRWLSIGLF